MSELWTEVLPVAAITPSDQDRMLSLMHLVYQGVRADSFARDLADKDECIMVRTAAGELVGFATQKLLRLQVQDRPVEGLFSGDAVIHPDHWGSPVIFQAFARRYIVADRERWWFLVSKGHRTYRMMTIFFTTFHPDRSRPTPPWEQAVMDAYARRLFGDDHDAERGVLAYRTPKDRLRPEHIRREQTARHPDAIFFEQANPGYVDGHDLVCLTRLHPDNLRPQLRARLLG